MVRRVGIQSDRHKTFCKLDCHIEPFLLKNISKINVKEIGQENVINGQLKAFDMELCVYIFYNVR